MSYSVNWPYPQMLIGSDRQLVIVRDDSAGRFLMLNVRDDWLLELVSYINDSVYGTDYTPWEMADFGTYVLATNGEVLFFYDSDAGTFQASDTITSIPQCRTVCSYNLGQLFYGCVTSADWYGADETFFGWGEIGQISCRLNRKNTAGVRRPRRGGEVYKVRQLGKAVIGYTNRELVVFTPVSDPAPTFAMEDLLPVGVCSRGAMCGNEHVHVFVDLVGNLWRLTSDKKVEKLGYKEYITQLGADDIVIVMNELEEEFYISDGKKSYLLTQYGLTEIYQAFTGMGVVNSSLCGISKAVGNREAVVVGDTIDFGFRPNKTISMMEIGGQAPGQMFGAYYYRTNNREGFQKTPWQEANEQGAVYQTVYGTDFQFAVKCEDFSKFDLDYLKIRWKMTDLRSIRGVYSPPPRGQNVSLADS